MSDFLSFAGGALPSVRARVYGAGGRQGAVTCGGAGSGQRARHEAGRRGGRAPVPQQDLGAGGGSPNQRVHLLERDGFHKVMQYESGSAKQEQYGSGKYQHPFFRKGQEELLSRIKRKTAENQCDRTGSRNKSEVSINDLEGDQLRVQADTSRMWTRVAENCSKNFCISGTSLDSIKKEEGRTDAASDFVWISKADIKLEPFDTSVSVVSRLGSSLAECSGKIHPSDTDWVLEHHNRSCEIQEHLESAQATDNSGLDTEAEDYNSTCSDSGHIEKRRKMNHFGIQKTEQHLYQMHNDSIKLTEGVLALEEKSLRKLSEISSILSTLASYIMNTEKSQRLSQLQGELTES